MYKQQEYDSLITKINTSIMYYCWRYILPNETSHKNMICKSKLTVISISKQISITNKFITMMYTISW